MLRLIHMVDEKTSEDNLRLLSLLLRRLPSSELHQEVIAIGRISPPLAVPPEIRVHKAGRRLAWPLASAPDVQRILKARRPDLVHAWSGSTAAVAALLRIDSRRISVTSADPVEAPITSRWWRSLQGQAEATIICSAKQVQRRLIETGVPSEATLVIRPGVDFAAIREARTRITRGELGLPSTARVLLTPSPPSRPGGQFMAMWATAILYQIWPDVRMIISGESREQRRLLRLLRHIYCSDAFLFIDNKFNINEVLAVADALIVPAADDIATGWLAWAMAASVPVIGTAIPSIAELIADRHNGFLCRPGEVHTLALRIRTALESPELLRQCIDTARGQAYDVFRAQGCADQYLRFFQNLRAGRNPAEGVLDLAVDA